MASQMSPLARPSEPINRDEATDEIDTGEQFELLELLGDAYTRRVLEAVTQKPRSGREVMEVAEVSKATAYRRLSELEDAGLIESETVFDPNGHHHEQFRAVVEAVDIRFGSDGVDVSIETADNTGSEMSPPARQRVAND